MDTINIVIFSKNRPMQLDVCLRSLRNHFKDFSNKAAVSATVIYTISDNDYQDSYNKLIEDHKDFKFVRQGAFRVDTMAAIDANKQYTMFLVDDIIFKSDFSMSDYAFRLLKNNSEMLALSLRLHKSATYCYATDSNMNVPKFVRAVPNAAAVWKFLGCEGDWGYGLSLDGNIYNTQFILWMLARIDFNNPNELEANLNHPTLLSGIRPTFMCCYDGISKLLNVPANRVQNTFQNRHENSYDEKALNDKFNQGHRISLDNITGIDNYSVHYPIDFQFFKKEEG